MSDLTKKAIIAAFISLADSQPIEKISVKQITDLCGISRNTFYYHYEDIYALVRDIVHTKSVKLFDLDFDSISWEEGWIRAAEYTKKNRRFIRNIYDCVGRDVFEEYMLSITDNAVRKSLFSDKTIPGVAKEEADLFLFVVKKNFAMIAIDWIRGDMTTDPVELVKKYISLLRNTMPKLLLGMIGNV